MKLSMSSDAKTKIAAAMGPNQRLLLSFDDGVGPFSNVGYCSLDTSFDLIIVDKDAETPDYDAMIDSDLGPVAVKDYSKTYMSEHMQLTENTTFHTLQLTGDSEQLDPNVQIKVMSGSTAE
ncbi:iron-sulfur cluster biosynthesis family protein [Furfurilactobacillus milii]|uniref:Iron-sulfur cluster biosynthesis family protein n=1 Tax=Furfurilactobacillus milii TaxID=2888272 RepID=A0A6N9I1G3_9LACO|nr:iron-sulfur cluster biosynthesis family protein [Furfurilactobacillus milii]MYV16689.1 iron-sulfur cluster biosynthesis family protein [Furfurilactobacillus milii]